MTTIAELFALAWQNQQAGNFGQAELLYRQVLQAEPAHAEAWARLGSVCARQGRNTEAIDSYSQALKLRPERVQTHYNLGIVLHSQGRSQEALVCFQHAIRLSPTLAQPHFSLGHVLQEQGRLDEAMAAYREALRLNPQYAEVHNNIAIARESQGRLEEAVASFHQALRLNPNFAAAHTNLGLTLQRQGRLEEALPLHQQALRLDPNSYTANYNLGFAFQEQGNYDQATACLQQALRLRPSAKLRIALATRLPLIYQSMTELQSWRNRLIQEVRQLREQQVVHDLTEEPGLNLLFYLAYQGLNDRDLQREFAHLHRAPELPVASARHLSDPENRKIRVGFLSSFFCEHTIGHLMGGLVAKLSRADFDVTVLSVGCREDATVGFFKQHADCYLQVPRHLSTARRLIAEQHLDVLFYTDIGMDTFTTALAFAARTRPMRHLGPPRHNRDRYDRLLYLQ